MDRLTTDNPKNNIETALNLFYIKNHETWVRGYGPNFDDVNLFDLIRTIVKVHVPGEELPTDNDDLANMMAEWLDYDVYTAEGVIALLYAAAWSYAELRHKLMRYEDAEQDGRLVDQKATPGDQVWIIERDECEEPCEISGYMFLASTWNAVIVTAYINSLEGLEETLDYHIQETAENYDTDLAVFPAEDCYLTREEAEAALAGKGGIDE